MEIIIHPAFKRLLLKCELATFVDFYFEADLKAITLVLGSRRSFHSSQTFVEFIQHEGTIYNAAALAGAAGERGGRRNHFPVVCLFP